MKETQATEKVNLVNKTKSYFLKKKNNKINKSLASLLHER
jgi:hypothetical protein